MKFWVRTYGCQMNERDSAAVSALLTHEGHRRARGESDADLVIVNTCSVRGKAEEKALGKLALLVRDKGDRRGAMVGAMGCMVEMMGMDLLRRLPGLDFAIGTHRMRDMPAVIERVALGERPILLIGGEDRRATGVGEEVGETEGPSAFVNVLFGCNRGCSYCVVPRVRGREWSRPVPDILAEVRLVAGQGVREVTLLGQSVLSYGRSGENVWPEDVRSPGGFREPFPRLLEAVGAVKGIERIRFTSGHPSGCTEELARAMKETPAVCDHLHLPLQSGCDRILALMRRGYTRDSYRRAVERLRSALPEMAFTTDIIVGFPSESDADFAETRRFMDEIGFDNCFVFKYSPRPNTEAASRDDDVPAEEKLRRNKALLEDQDRRALSINRKWEGRVVRVMAEGKSRRNADKWAGRTTTNKIVIFEPMDGLAVGDLADVRIERVMPLTLYGSVVSRASSEGNGDRTGEDGGNDEIG